MAQGGHSWRAFFGPCSSAWASLEVFVLEKIWWNAFGIGLKKVGVKKADSAEVDPSGSEHTAGTRSHQASRLQDRSARPSDRIPAIPRREVSLTGWNCY